MKYALVICLQLPLKKRIPVDVLNSIDHAWCYAKGKDDFKNSQIGSIMHFYQILYQDYQMKPDVLISHVMRAGISRHIDIIYKTHSDLFNKLIAQDMEFQLYVKRYIVQEKQPIETLVSMFPENDIEQLRKWYDSVRPFSSGIIEEENVGVPQQPNEIIEALIMQMVLLKKSNEPEEVFKEVMIMIREIADNIVRQDPNLESCTPILVGSKNENTQCFYPNEYDLFMQCDYVDSNSDFDEADLMKTIKAAVNDYNCT